MDIVDIFQANFINLETVFNTVPDGVIVASPAKDFLFWNDAAKKIMGDVPDNKVPPEDWAERYRIVELNSDKYVEFNDLPIIKALNGEEYFDYRLRTITTSHPEGIIVSVCGRPIRSGEATVGGMITFRDITAQVKLEDKIRSERLFYERLLDLMPGIVFIKDLDGKFLYGNKCFHELLGTESVQGKTTQDYLVKEMVDIVRRHDEIVLKSGTAQEFEEIIHWLDGTKSTFHTTRFPYIPHEGEVQGVCAVARDITKDLEIKDRLEKERNRNAEVSKLAAIGILSAEIAHEIKNPLTIMRTTNDVIKAALEDPQIDKEFIKKKVDVLNETIIRMDKVASSLNTLSKNTASEEATDFILMDIIDDVKNLCSFRTKKMMFDVSVSGTACNEHVEGNRIQISEVLLNLIMNALDAVENVPHPAVSIECEADTKEVWIKIIDNGPGIKKDIRDKIFDPFFTTKGLQRGTGLGLSISKKIIDQHKGFLDYFEKGNTHGFLIELPKVQMN